MRHLLWFVIGVVLAAVGAVLAALGSRRALVAASQLVDGPRTTGLVLVVVAGLLLGLLAATRRFSPAGPLAGGALLVALGVLDWVDPGAVPGVVEPAWGDLADGLQVLSGTGGTLLIGLVLLVLSLLPAARRRPRGDDGREDDGFTAVPPSTPQAWSPPER